MSEACRLLARAFMSNPDHVAAFGTAALAKNEAFFRAALQVLKGQTLVATDGSRIVGLIHWVDSPRCQVGGIEKLRLIPVMVSQLGVGATVRVVSWLSTWSKHDPRKPHVHLGPVGVLPEAQGQHIGSRLMTRYCEALTETGAVGYLETDRPENVAFYRRFGFETTKVVRVIGAKNYLMSRPGGLEPPTPGLEDGAGKLLK